VIVCSWVKCVRACYVHQNVSRFHVLFAMHGNALLICVSYKHMRLGTSPLNSCLHYQKRL